MLKGGSLVSVTSQAVLCHWLALQSCFIVQKGDSHLLVLGMLLVPPGPHVPICT